MALDKAYFLIVGVSNGGMKGLPLRAARNDAESISRLLVEFGYPRSKSHLLLVDGEVTQERIKREMDTFGERDADLLLVYWAGHAKRRSEDGEIYLYMGDTQDDEYHSRMISFRELATSLANTRKRYVLILDTCYSGKVNDFLQAMSHSEGFCTLAACGRSQKAEETALHGYLTDVLLEELKAAQSRGETVLAFPGVFEAVAKALDPRKIDTLNRQAHDISLRIRLRSENPRPTAPADPLEEALGYVVQAFRAYLNENVVSNVELIYFLGYDVWDGCLVYDGLVQESIEQQLLNFIRSRFLMRDRLRSKYEELMALQSRDLGMAGICFREANRMMAPGSDRHPSLAGLMYIGDLSLYKSEYGHFDRLLGLRSCLYIPLLVEAAFPSSPADPDDPRQARRPLGGVLMAANRRPHGLKPRCIHEDEAWPPDTTEGFISPRRGDLAELNLSDRWISERIQEDLTGIGKNASQEERRTRSEEFQHSTMYSLLRSVGGVYQQRASRRLDLRKGLHPRFLKTAKRKIDENEKGLPSIDRTLANIYKISRMVDESSSSSDLLEYVERVRRREVAEFLPDESRNDPDAERLARNYGIATVWRDIKLEIQSLKSKKERDNSEEDRLARLGKILRSPWTASDGTTWQEYIDQYQRFDRVEDLPLPEPGDGRIWKLSVELINDLLDDLREARKPPFEIAYGAIEQLAPVQRYIGAVAQLEGTFGGITQQRMFNDLAHALLVWALGLWILSTRLPSIQGESETIRGLFAKHIEHELKKRHLGDWLTSLKPGQFEDFIVLFWNLIAATHDIAIPVQRFENNFRDFFNKYFGQGSIPEREGSFFSVMVDILDHPRFPIYKNAITSLYQNKHRERDWVEAIFHHALAKNILHSTVGALILIRELEPDGEQANDTRSGQALWHAILPALDSISWAQEENPELGLLIPAYLAHAVTFSQLPDFRELWLKLTSRWKKESHLGYLRRQADEFQVDLEKYPLTYILALLEVILEPLPDQELPDPTGNDLPTPHGYSPFYVHDVQVKRHEDPEKKWILQLKVRFWGESLKDEENHYSVKFVTAYYKDYYSDSQKRVDALSAEKPRIRQIVQMLDRLVAFEQCFKSRDWSIEVCFENLEKDTGQYFTYPDDIRRSPRRKDG